MCVSSPLCFSLGVDKSALLGLRLTMGRLLYEWDSIKTLKTLGFDKRMVKLSQEGSSFRDHCHLKKCQNLPVC